MFLTRGAAKAAIALTLMMVSASAWAVAGYVYDAVGEVSIAAGKNAAHRAAKNDAIPSAAIVNTGDHSYAVLKFEDGQVATMQANTSFHVREYRYEPKHAENNSIIFSKFKGGMRFITGLIGQRNHKAFRLSTPNATIGIRGTEFMVATINDALYGQVISGSISMTNAAGMAVFTAGQTILVASANTLPKTISATDLPAGTFSQLDAIPATAATPIPVPAGSAAPVSTAAAVLAAIPATVSPAGTSSQPGGVNFPSLKESGKFPALGAISPPPAAPPGNATSAVAAASAVGATPAATSLTGTSKRHDATNFANSQEANGLPFFQPSVDPVRTPASDAALAAATGDSARAAVAAATISRNEAAAGLFGKHNFTPTGIATGEICAFCHTPQGAEASVAAPLWNRSAPPVSPYRAYSTLASATAEATGSISMACLSCHDGTQAPNVMIRSPDANMEADSGRHSAPASVRSELRSHHPVGMRYAGGGQNQNMPDAPLNSPSGSGGQNQAALAMSRDSSIAVDVNTFNNVDFKTTSHSGSGSGTVWWVDTGGGGRQKTDLYLFTRTDTTDYAGIPVANETPLSQPYVECATCHDPHRVANPTFLRILNTGSAVCLTCHNK